MEKQLVEQERDEKEKREEQKKGGLGEESVRTRWQRRQIRQPDEKQGVSQGLRECCCDRGKRRKRKTR